MRNLANKRTRKKQEKKKKISFLSSEGVSRKQLKKTKGKQLENLYKKKEKNKKNRDRLRSYREEAERWGLENPSQYTSRKKLDKAITSQKRKITRERNKAEKRRKHAEQVEGLNLFVFWTDKGGFDLEEWYTQRSEVERVYDLGGTNGLKQYIWDNLNDRYGVPTGEFDIVYSEKHQVMDMTEYYYADGFNEVYRGKCQYLLPLLKLIATMMTCLYDPQHKRAFIRQLKEAVHIFDEGYAIEISNLLKRK